MAPEEPDRKAEEIGAPGGRREAEEAVSRSPSRRGSRSWGIPPRWHPPAPPKLPPSEPGIKVKQAGSTWGASGGSRPWNRCRPSRPTGSRGAGPPRTGRVHDMGIGPGAGRAGHGVPTGPLHGDDPGPASPDADVGPGPPPHGPKGDLLRPAPCGRDAPGHRHGLLRDRGSLFPASREDLDTSCPCANWANPCKHVAATHYVLGEAFDRDPFLLFELRGRTWEQVLDAVRRHRSGAGAQQGEAEPPGVPLPPRAGRPPASR